MKLNLRPILGTEVGISLSLMQAMAHHQLTPYLVLCNLALSHSIYGRDRLKDQVAELEGTLTEKEEYNVFNYTTSVANMIAFWCLLKLESTNPGSQIWTTFPIVTFLSNAYSKAKPVLGVAKPFFIGVLWAYAIVILPPDEVTNNLFLVYSSLYAATSNLADIKDIQEDQENEIQTIPVAFGEKTTYIVSAVLASVALATHTTFNDWTIGDTFIEIVSAGLFLYSSIMSF